METPATLRNEKEEMIRRWQQSGLSQIEFCRKENISFHGFYYWKKRICKTEKKPSGKFLKLRTAPPLPVNIFAEVILQNGSRVVLHREVPLKELKQLAE